MSLAFEKWEGLGNHFVLLESLPNEVTVQELCDPRRGVGADGTRWRASAIAGRSWSAAAPSSRRE